MSYMEYGRKFLCHKKGTEIFCEDGHKVAEVIEDLYKGDHPYAQKISNYESTQKVPNLGDALPIKCWCGAKWFEKHHFVNANKTDLWIQT